MQPTPADGCGFSEEGTEGTLKGSGNGYGSQTPTRERTPVSDVASFIP